MILSTFRNNECSSWKKSSNIFANVGTSGFVMKIKINMSIGKKILYVMPDHRYLCALQTIILCKKNFMCRYKKCTKVT